MHLDDAAARCAEGGFVWLGLFEPTPQELTQVRAKFGLHALAVEDAEGFHLRPKFEHYDSGHYLAILRTARYDDKREQIDTGEISVFLSDTFVITVRKGVASELHEARSRLERHPELARTGSASVLWAILDHTVDCYAPVVAALDTDIEQIEATVFSGVVAPTERIYFLRREASDFYRAVHPLLAVLASQLQPAKWPAELLPYFRDVYDHLVLVSEEVAAQRDALGTILEANIAVISVEQSKIALRQSATMEQLTIFASIFLPLSFVVGFFGQNFDWLVTHIQSFPIFAVFGIGGLILPTVLLFLWLRRRRKERSTEEAAARPLNSVRGVAGGLARQD
ncbi:MAG TPA: CorA family divalent cation transporter [Pseudonocardia sp.]|jgi:magnesium transporter|uniref:CorA family divalent cation transporter n=1 Tax=Pseudonocardia sp. TaxID=60912 RepID=UPI002F41C0E7